MAFTDLRHALRAIAARPAFSALVVVVLAAGLACVLYVAGLINGLIVRPLPFAQPERLWNAGLIDNDDALDSEDYDTLTADEFLDWRARLAGVADVAGWGVATVNLSDGERPERYSGAYTTANLWPALGVQPALGRGFVADDERPGAPLVVLLSDSVWRTRYLADPRIVGRTVRVNTREATVVGVMPPDVSFPERETVWLPATLARGAESAAELAVLLRLADGATADRAQAVLDAWLADLRRERPDHAESRARAIGLRPLHYGFVPRDTRGLFALMFAAVVVVLLIACANVANLLLTQIASRAQELAVRVALGASRGRLMAHLLAQTLVLSLGAVALALPLAQGMIGATDALFRASAEDGPPHWMRFDLDAPLVAAAVAAAVVTALLTGILPALRAGAASGQTLHQGGRVASGSAFVRVSRLLVVGEIALSCVLLIAAATIVQSIRDLERFDLGMRTDGVLTARIGLFEGKYPDDTAIRAYAAALLRALRADPAVVDATLSSSLPGLMGENVDVLPPGVPMPPGGLPNPGHSAVDAGFFATMGATLVAGRAFTDADRADAAPVMIVDETFVRRFVPDGRAVGRAFVVDPLDETPVTATVVGVVRPIQMEDVDDAIEPAVLTPFAQRPARFFSVLVRTRGAPAAFGERLRAIVGALDADTPAYWIRTYDDVLREATFGERVLVRVFGGFGLVALLLAAAGLYGVVAFSVAQRTREIGVRRALGESDGSVLATVGARSAVQVLAGLALGALGGVPFARLLAASINQPVDGAVAGWLAVIGLLALVAAVAVLVPARRALQVDPIVALRHE